MINRLAGATGGHFSICYHAHHPEQGEGFLKALNFSAMPMVEGEQLVDQVNRFTAAFIFERDLLTDCISRRLSRIVRILDSGEALVPEAGPFLSRVPYLIFEPADGDIRAFQSALSQFDIAWVFRAMKHVVQGIEQLHAGMTTHQDLKPSNVLTMMSGAEMKLGDLGCAERRGVDGPRSLRPVPGAATYAPPEQQYGAFGRRWEERQAADLYLAGSLGTQLFLGHCMSALIQSRLPADCRLGSWKGFFADLIPYLRLAHAEVIEMLRKKVALECGDPDLTERYVACIAQLTAPDPTERGHPKDRAAKTSSYSVRRYVTTMNMLMARAEAQLLRGRRG
jgi:serine/threonine protein kinase